MKKLILDQNSSIHKLQNFIKALDSTSKTNSSRAFNFFKLQARSNNLLKQKASIFTQTRNYILIHSQYKHQNLLLPKSKQDKLRPSVPIVWGSFNSLIKINLSSISILLCLPYKISIKRQDISITWVSQNCSSTILLCFSKISTNLFTC